MARFGYLVPEFPGQTHSFFWREMAALKSMGMEPELISTRRPEGGRVPHQWADAAEAETHYLVPPGLADTFGAGSALLHGLIHGKAAALRGAARGYSDNQNAADGWRARIMGVLRSVSLLLAASELVGVARRRGWVHVHVHSCADAAQVALFAHRLSGLPYSLALHGPLADYGPNQADKWRNASFGVVITKGLLGDIRQRLGPALPERMGIAAMGVDTADFVRSAPYEPWTGTGPARIFSCGRLNPSKGHRDLVAAVRMLADAGIDARLVIAGEDERGGKGYRLELERLVTELDVGGRVTLLGSVSEATVRTRLEEAHVFALASHAEPLGVAIMEAMSLSVPVVVTGSGGVAELVQDQQSGLLVRANDPAHLASTLVNVLHTPDLARRLGAEGRHRVVGQFDSTRGAGILADMIRGR
ncbi:exopolysaccharide biosynthesis GT4 family glycosyltransferase EpsE [Arthrobacter sp. EPSL27]|uniref:exopolysaccharide biosynthesis GT4 family glycosyltransferase EpsE n=1 Tax=Arthrobacter sp. EPSL27 TaxID=1745378 RepID=UPI0007485841|nr:exopolysaccharide biosynthesis GT4 family glycosyltransferase EpsE [Arthrobacter sp. EPSL27]KUM39345.1 hypothetical protein AR539_01605 [Arthrobacter sp. EPSL27]